MENHQIQPELYYTDGFNVSLGLHHGTAESGKPLFLQVKVFNNHTETTEFETMGAGYGKISILHDDKVIQSELPLEMTQAGLMKKVEFPSAGAYRVIVLFKKGGNGHKAEFTVHIEEGYIRDSPVG